MVDNPVHGGIIGDEGDDLHHSPAFGAGHRVHLIDLPDHGRPTFGRVEINAVPEGLDDGDNAGLERRPGRNLQIEEKRPLGTAAKIPQELPLELEEHPEHLGNRKDHLTMRNIQEERLPHPLAPLLKTLGMAGRAKPSGFAGKHQKMFCPAARAPDPSKSAAGIAAVEIALDDILDDRPEEAVFPLKTPLLFRDEPLEMMKKHPVENGAFRMARAVDSRHIGNEASRNAPGTGQGKNPGTAPRNGAGHASINFDWGLRVRVG